MSGRARPSGTGRKQGRQLTHAQASWARGSSSHQSQAPPLGGSRPRLQHGGGGVGHRGRGACQQQLGPGRRPPSRKTDAPQHWVHTHTVQDLNPNTSRHELTAAMHHRDVKCQLSSNKHKHTRKHGCPAPLSPLSPYARLGGTMSLRRPPTRMPLTPRSRPLRVPPAPTRAPTSKPCGVPPVTPMPCLRGTGADALGQGRRAGRRVSEESLRHEATATAPAPSCHEACSSSGTCAAPQPGPPGSRHPNPLQPHHMPRSREGTPLHSPRRDEGDPLPLAVKVHHHAPALGCLRARAHHNIVVPAECGTLLLFVCGSLPLGISAGSRPTRGGVCCVLAGACWPPRLT